MHNRNSICALRLAITLLFALSPGHRILWRGNIILLLPLHAGNGNIKALLLYDLWRLQNYMEC